MLAGFHFQIIVKLPQIHVLPEFSDVILLGNRVTEDVTN